MAMFTIPSLDAVAMTPLPPDRNCCDRSMAPPGSCRLPFDEECQLPVASDEGVRVELRRADPVPWTARADPPAFFPAPVAVEGHAVMAVSMVHHPDLPEDLDVDAGLLGGNAGGRSLRRLPLPRFPAGKRPEPPEKIGLGPPHDQEAPSSVLDDRDGHLEARPLPASGLERNRPLLPVPERRAGSLRRAGRAARVPRQADQAAEVHESKRGFPSLSRRDQLPGDAPEDALNAGAGEVLVDARSEERRE